MTALSLVVPMFDEVDGIEAAANAFLAELRGLAEDVELVFSDDGSRDGTAERVEAWIARTGAPARVVRAPRNEGKGAALTRGLGATQGGIVAYIDADLEIPTRYLRDVVEGVRAGADVCIGSKVIEGADNRRELRRKVAHHGYNALARRLLGSTVSDHSCGVKAFTRQVLDAVLPLMEDPGWVWDTEFLVRAQHHGFRVREVPVRTEVRRASKVRFFQAATRSLAAVVGLWRRGVRA